MKRARFFLVPFVAAAILFAAEHANSFRIMGGKVPEVGEEALDFSLPATDGREVKLSDFKGKVILLSFWSCYTDSCSTAVRTINALLEEYGGKGLSALT